MNTIIFNDVSSEEFDGLIIAELPAISKPALRYEIIEIDGRDGDIVEELGYSAIDKALEIGVTQDADIDAIFEWLSGSGTVVFSNEPTKYYNAQILAAIDFERLVKYRKATVTFHCQPFKFALGEAEVELTSGSTSVTNEGNTTSKPLITITGAGTIELYVNDNLVCSLELDDDGETIIIDSDEQEAYYDGTLKNRQMTGDFPTLSTGENTITIGDTGTFTDGTILPRSRWL